MRILYGVAGEGLGHAMRTQAVAQHLLAQGHEVRVLAAGRAADALRPHVPDVRQIEGLELAIRANRVDRGATAMVNLRKALTGLRHNVGVWQDLLAEPMAQPQRLAVGAEPRSGAGLRLVAGADDAMTTYRPDVVVSDFETWTWLCARTHGLPVITLDNCQALNRLKHPDALLRGHRGAFEVARSIVKAKAPGADHYIIPTFFRADVAKKRTTVTPPILRPSVLRAVPTEGAHVVVYQSATGWADLPTVLKRFADVEFRIYGFRRDVTADVRDDNLLYRPLSDAGFLADLASSRAVIASAGFTLMSEVLWLQKPMLALPLAGQFEQILNARWLAHLGYGMVSESLTKKDVHHLLERTDAFRHKLRKHRQHGNADALEVVDQVLERVV